MYRDKAGAGRGWLDRVDLGYGRIICFVAMPLRFVLWIISLGIFGGQVSCSVASWLLRVDLHCCTCTLPSCMEALDNAVSSLFCIARLPVQQFVVIKNKFRHFRDPDSSGGISLAVQLT
jgi:hypothetical protein